MSCCSPRALIVGVKVARSWWSSCPFLFARCLHVGAVGVLTDETILELLESLSALICCSSYKYHRLEFLPAGNTGISFCWDLLKSLSAGICWSPFMPGVAGVPVCWELLEPLSVRKYWNPFLLGVAGVLDCWNLLESLAARSC